MKKAKEKKNPMIKDMQKVKNIKINNNDFDDDNVIKKFIIITIGLIIIVGAVYGITELFKDKEEESTSITTGSINYNKITVGTLFNRPYDEYYVLVYNSDAADAVLYSTILTKYMQNSENKDYIKIYYCDLDNKLNASYYDVNNDGKSNPQAKEFADLNFGDLTLLRIKNGEIKSYIEDFEEIKDLLKIVTEE